MQRIALKVPLSGTKPRILHSSRVRSCGWSEPRRPVRPSQRSGATPMPGQRL